MGSSHHHHHHSQDPKNIKIMRLVTGEDIIGNISESQGLITIKKAFVIIPMQATPGKPVQLVLSPWQPYTDDKEIVIDDSKVITITSPKDDIIKSYESHTRVLENKQVEEILRLEKEIEDLQRMKEQQELSLTEASLQKLQERRDQELRRLEEE
uniref:TIP60 n=1 Tax=synthetic construct TaxID=32630 RepID=UPI0014269EF5|nr:Chain A, TIP60 [synthetic construct]7EQ9_AA Chain AA, TIP60 [synthetic construct]7EQ9_AB Chain AB, TIP60 [synthetic construct]7EQ9_B Chain B, TIP60 [synthetic construct]7EQ9_BA Chain BA, TIP60 [synthetic construct]7EQ9_BB Chain BB, TIP60 [synthetic construct]7EQ9_C Chain C, TIP60 [synthetic construct]7EQ9_CA Chain CA, TIP60 [synthetic construct]7EQ9_CB Chain CB, TIP60 [synthetic construct]7EQ9_D Chain D, TIP60 [synthetic construct]7EQ9_DA Chain DA, TIP60 [synthetic construct]7EQ9_DB C